MVSHLAINQLRIDNSLSDNMKTLKKVYERPTVKRKKFVSNLMGYRSIDMNLLAVGRCSCASCCPNCPECP